MAAAREPSDADDADGFVDIRDGQTAEPTASATRSRRQAVAAKLRAARSQAGQTEGGGRHAQAPQAGPPAPAAGRPAAGHGQHAGGQRPVGGAESGAAGGWHDPLGPAPSRSLPDYPASPQQPASAGDSAGPSTDKLPAVEPQQQQPTHGPVIGQPAGGAQPPAAPAARDAADGWATPGARRPVVPSSPQQPDQGRTEVLPGGPGVQPRSGEPAASSPVSAGQQGVSAQSGSGTDNSAPAIGPARASSGGVLGGSVRASEVADKASADDAEPATSPAVQVASGAPETGELPAIPAEEAERLGSQSKQDSDPSLVERWARSLREDPITPKLVIVAVASLVLGTVLGSLLLRGGSASESSVSTEGAAQVGPREGMDSAMPCGTGEHVAFVAAVGPPEAYTQAVGTLYTQMAKTTGTEFDAGSLRLTIGKELCAKAAEGYTDISKRADWYFIWAGPFATAEEADGWCGAMGYRQLGKDCLVKSTS